MRNWLMRGAIALGIFVLGGLAGWIGRGSSSEGGDVARISFYQDWRLACPADKEQKASCELANDVVDQKSGTRLAQLTMGRQADKENTRVMVVSVPLTVLLASGMGLQFGSETQTYQYVTCVPSGCVAMVPVDDKLIASMGAAQSMAIVVTAENGKSVSLPVSVQGYGAASKALNEIEAKRHSWWRRLWS